MVCGANRNQCNGLRTGLWSVHFAEVEEDKCTGFVHWPFLWRSAFKVKMDFDGLS